MEGPTESKFLMGQFSRIFYWIYSFFGNVFGGIFFSLQSVVVEQWTSEHKVVGLPLPLF
jgi:hypothetical protein